MDMSALYKDDRVRNVVGRRSLRALISRIKLAQRSSSKGGAEGILEHKERKRI